MTLDDTITAITTPYGESGIGIVRVSGKDCMRIFKTLFRSKSKTQVFKSHTLYHGEVINPSNGEPIDEVLAVFMKSPKTYTREDCVEFQCHGGYLVLRRVLEAVLSMNTRLAEPGEFTKRAFLNGRIDLSQAEAVIDIIRANTDKSHKFAHDQLRGNLSNKINHLKKKLLHILAEIESIIDFQEEEDLDFSSFEELNVQLMVIETAIEELCSSFHHGRLYREGARAIILGKTNVGKSSILNRLLGEERAIVTSQPGTTRDFIEEKLDIDGIPITIIDTAGLGPASEIIEKMSQKMTQKSLDSADFIIYVLDISRPIDQEDIDKIKKIEPSKRLIVLNKMDLRHCFGKKEISKHINGNLITKVSALQDIGFEELKASIAKRIQMSEIDLSCNAVITNLRHKLALDETLEKLYRVESGLLSESYPELIALDLKHALDCLGKITGETTSEEVLDIIFSEFCIGK
jgi:tRNA modification GTPase